MSAQSQFGRGRQPSFGGARARPWRRRVVAVASLLLVACAEQRIHTDTQTQLDQGNYEAAADTLDAAVQAYPLNPQLRADAIRTRDRALERLLAEAAAARNDGRFDDAQAKLERAKRFDANNGERVTPLLSALAAERRQAEAKAKAEELVAKQDLQGASRVVAEALKDNPRQPQLLALQRRIELLARQAQPRTVRLKETRPISLDFRDANLRTVLDAVTRNSGVVPEVHAQTARPVRRRAHQHAVAARHAREHRAG
jgi:general secretion pathway protein D